MIVFSNLKIRSSPSQRSYQRLFIGLYLKDGHVYGRGTGRPIIPEIKIAEEKSVFKDSIDMAHKYILVIWMANFYINAPFG
jgi:hypothetical protein